MRVERSSNARVYIRGHRLFTADGVSYNEKPSASVISHENSCKVPGHMQRWDDYERAPTDVHQEGTLSEMQALVKVVAMWQATSSSRRTNPRNSEDGNHRAERLSLSLSPLARLDSRGLPHTLPAPQTLRFVWSISEFGLSSDYHRPDIQKWNDSTVARTNRPTLNSPITTCHGSLSI